ncbi:MAG: ExbD/TolR family protein [Pseudobdellovibrionaceae bacterium]
MAIHKPGEKFRLHRLLRSRGKKREVVAMLSLTAMVDMFTVLVIFLLQNYNVTGAVLYIPKEVVLPKAESTKDLKPAFVVTISDKEVLLDRDAVASYAEVQAQQDWMIQPLFDKLKAGLIIAKEEYDRSLQVKLQSAVDSARGEDQKIEETWNKITIQADKDLDFLTVKKVMYTIVEAGAGEVNFAVNKDTPSKTK